MAADPTLLEHVRKARRSLDENGPTTVRSVGDFNRVSVAFADADVLRDWLLAERARVVIEIGLAYGVSALAIAEALVANGASDDCDWQAVATAARYFEANADWQLQQDDRRTRLHAYRLPSPRGRTPIRGFQAVRARLHRDKLTHEFCRVADIGPNRTDREGTSSFLSHPAYRLVGRRDLIGKSLCHWRVLGSVV